MKRGDNIEVTLEGEETPAQIIARWKVGGGYYNHFTIREVNGLEYYINLEDNSWNRIPVEQVIIPRANMDRRNEMIMKLNTKILKT